MIVHQHPLPSLWVQEGYFELEGVDVVLVGGDLVQVDRYVPVYGDVGVVILVILFLCLFLLGCSILQPIFKKLSPDPLSSYGILALHP